MLYEAKAAVCSQIRTKRPAQSEHYVECLNVNPYPANVEKMVNS